MVLNPKYSFVVDHQAKTGVEKPISHAGIATRINISIDALVMPKISKGIIANVDIIVPTMKISHNCLTGGICSGPVFATR